MATRHISVTIFLLFLSLVLLPHLLPVSNGAIYRIHDLKLRNKQIFNKVSSSTVLTKGVPIPPSGPSKRHNDQPDGDRPGPGGSASASASAKDGVGV